MNEALIENWNNVVGPEDSVYHMGDVALGKWDEWDKSLSRLNGRKRLIVGNHDRLFQETNAERRLRWHDEYSKWFDDGIYSNSETALSDGTRVMLSHFPYDGDSHDADRFTAERLRDRGVILLHGHTHSNSVLSKSLAGTVQVHVGVDAHNFTPVSEDQVINYIKIAKNGVDNV